MKDKKHILFVIFLLILSSAIMVLAAPPPGNQEGVPVASFSGAPQVLSSSLQANVVSAGLGDDGGGSSAWKLAVREGGTMEFKKPQEDEWSPVWQAKLLRDGDKVRTGGDGYVKVVLADGSWVVFGPNTEVDLKLIKMSPQPLLQTFEITIGKLWFAANKFLGHDNNFEITTPNGILGSRGTKYSVEVKDNTTIVNVYEGIVYINSFYDNLSYNISQGQRAILFRNKPLEIKPLEGEPLQISFSEPCSSFFDFKTKLTNPYVASMYQGVKKNYSFCLQKDLRPKLIFYANQFLDAVTVNKDTVIVQDEDGPVEGYYEVDSSIIFIPSRPLFGKVSIKLMGICSLSNVCLDKDMSFQFDGAEKDKGTYFQLSEPVTYFITKKIVLNNSGSKTAKDITLSTLSFKSFFPNTLVRMYNVSQEYQLVEGENNHLLFKIKELRPGETWQTSIDYAFLTLAVNYYPDVTGLEKYENAELVQKLTKAEPRIESDNPQIIALAQKIVGEEKNPFWKAYKIYTWITSTIKYDTGRSGGALATLQRRKGLCEDFTDLYISLARAAGVPARSVTLYVYEQKLVGHSLVEVYLPKYGWIPLDPTWGTNQDSFALENSALFILAKQEGVTSDYREDLGIMGTDAEQLQSSSTLEVANLDLNSNKDWQLVFKEPFFEDMYELVLSGQVWNDLYTLKVYNDGIGKDIFVLPQQPKHNFIIIEQKAIEAYQTKQYEKMRTEVQNASRENLQLSIPAYSSLLEKLKQNHSAFYDVKNLPELNHISSEVEKADEFLNKEEYFSAFDTFFSTYYGSRDFVSPLFGNYIFTIIKSQINTPDMLFKFNSGTVLFWGLALIFFVFLPIFWILMMVNCLRNNEFLHWNKAIWFIVILICYVLIPVGAIIYFFTEYIKKKKSIMKRRIKS